MKTRLGFVSNSSSSSFVLDINKLTKDQEYMIRNRLPNLNGDHWDIDFGDGKIEGFCVCDNYDIMKFFKEIELNCGAILEIEGHDW